MSDLRAALELEPNNSNTQAALGYALWDSGDIAQSREMLEQAHKGLPDDPALIRQLAYVNQRLDDMPATQHYARLVIDDIDNQALITPLTPEQNQQRFNFRRLHEEVGRHWTFSFDSSIGLRSGAMSTANNNVGGAAPGKSYRSYGQLEAEYRIGRNMLLEGDLLSVYSRVFADTGENGVMMPVKNPMSGTGLRWKPLRDQIFFLAVEQQLPLNGQNGASDTMLRASASFFNGGKYSDEWHRTVQAGLPKTCTSMRRNISARIFRRGRQIIESAGIRRWQTGRLLSLMLTFRTTVIVIKALRARSLAVSGSAGISGPARRTTTPYRTKSVSASNINIPLRRLINVTESATTRFSPLECTGKCVSSFSYC